MTVKVGPEEKQFYVHKTLLTHHSEYFRKALQPGRFKEGQEGIVCLEDVDASVFGVFVDWLYRQTMPVSAGWGVTEVTKLCPSMMTRCNLLACLFVLADRFIVPKLKPDLTKLTVTFFNTFTGVPNHETITYAYGNLSPHSPFLQLLADAYCKNWKPSRDYKEWKSVGELPKDFFRRLVYRYARPDSPLRDVPLVASKYVAEPPAPRDSA